MSRRLFLLMLMMALGTAVPAYAQEATPTPSPTDGIPLVHVVADGETLTYIAETYGVTIDALLAINNLPDADSLYVGQELIIPGGTGEAVATLVTVQAGDTLAGLAADYHTTETAVAATNRLINPYQSLPIGQTITVISRTGSAEPDPPTGTPHIVAPGETYLSIAAQYNISPRELLLANGLAEPVYLMPGQRLRIPGDGRYRPLPGEWKTITIKPLPIVQGNTLSIYVENLLDGMPTGELAGQTLHFYPYQQGYVALVGLDAFTEAGAHTLTLGGSGSRPWQPFSQDIWVQSGGYGVQYINVGEELANLLDPAIRANEDAFLSTIYAQSVDEPLWDGVFQNPVVNALVTARYGDGRSYNDGPIEIFHTGVDFAGTVGTTIAAPANGVVKFVGELELRGLTVVVDHGMGVMTAYFHLSDVFVAEGDTVQQGDRLAAGGSSGLSTGPHLHWEFQVNNVPVNGLQWTTTEFP